MESVGAYNQPGISRATDYNLRLNVCHITEIEYNNAIDPLPLLHTRYSSQ